MMKSMSSPPSATGPATMFPRLNPRPQPPPASKALENFVVTATRGPFLAAVVLHYVFLERVYRPVMDRLLNRLKLSERAAFGVMLPLVHSLTYSLSFALFEFIERNGLFERYRIGRTPGQEPTWEMKRVAFWETARGWPSMMIGGQILYAWLNHLGAPSLTTPLPSLAYSFKHLALSLFCSNVTFYVIHRALHYGPLYQRIHKKHHEFVGVKSVAAQSLHPVESILQTVPIFVGGLIFKTHPLVWLHFLGWRVYTGMEGHSGYCFRGSWLHRLGLTNADDAAYHDCHHTTWGNFGTYYLDWLFSTQDYWVAVGEDEGYLALCKRREEEARKRRDGQLAA